MSEERQLHPSSKPPQGPVEPSELDEYRRDPRRAITEDGVLCLVCGRFFRHLTNTHLQLHGLTSREYKQQFGYNNRRALMVAAAQLTHSRNASKAGLASHIRNRSIFDEIETKRMGGRRHPALEEVLTRRESRVHISPCEKFRDQKGRFVTALSLSASQLAAQSGKQANYTVIVNGRSVQTGEVPGEMPLLWVLRDNLNLKGTKFGCGVGQCGACTVHLDGEVRRSCQTQISAVGTQSITTIEGLSPDGSHPLQKAWLEVDVPQCGYCQAGQLMSAAALLRRSPNPTDDEISTAMNGNICRCGTYLRIRNAIHLAASHGRS